MTQLPYGKSQFAKLAESYQLLHKLGMFADLARSDTMDNPVHLIDDDPGDVKKVRLLLKSVGIPLTTYASAQDFLRQYNPATDAVVVTEVRLKGISGLELQERLSAHNVAVIFLTAFGTIPLCVQAIQAGALDFLEKPADDQKLLDKIQDGFDKVTQNRQLLLRMETTKARLDSLTPRESEIMDLLVTGLSNKAIYQQLQISRKTLDIHRNKVLTKMHCDTVADLVREVLTYRLTS